MKLDRWGAFRSDDKVAARRPEGGFDAIVEEVRVGLVSNLCANGIDEGIEEGMAMVEFQGRIFQQGSIEGRSGVQLDVEFIRLGSTSAFEGARRVVAKCAVGRKGLCASGRQGLIGLGGGLWSRGLSGLGK